MEMTSVKTMAVFVIMFGCFAVLYPRIFHPMLKQVFGFNRNSINSDDMLHPRLHPREKIMNPPKPNPSFSRPGVHPGMRAAAEMRKQASTQPGSGRGVVGYMLPVYAIGIIIYLIYTMSKVFGKGENEPVSEDDSVNAKNPYDGHFTPLRDKDATTAEEEMQLLRKRLEDTESQMDRILQAMEVVKARVPDTHQVPSTEKTSNRRVQTPQDRRQFKKETNSTESKSEKQAEGMANKAAHCTSSPEMDSYEQKRNEYDHDKDIDNRNYDPEHSTDDGHDDKHRVRKFRSKTSDGENVQLKSDIRTLKEIQRHLESVAERIEGNSENAKKDYSTTDDESEGDNLESDDGDNDSSYREGTDDDDDDNNDVVDRSSPVETIKASSCIENSTESPKYLRKRTNKSP